MQKTPSAMIYCDQDYARVQLYTNYFRYQTDSALFCFEIKKDYGISLPKSPVGGFCFFGENQRKIIQEIQQLETELHKHDVNKLKVTTTPEYYPGHITKDVMLAAGFQEEVSEISHFISIENNKWTHRLHPMEKRILKKRTDFTISPDQNLEEVHEFIAQCRIAQGLTISIELEIFLNLFETFPSAYKIFSARKHGKLISAVVTVAATDQIAYYFLPATDPAHKTGSPMVHLINYICEWYQQQGFKLLDLGISSEQGKPQTSLITFKERMGGIRTSRITYTKDL